MNKISSKIMLAIMICSITTATLLSVVSVQKSTRYLQDEIEKTLMFASEKYANQFSIIFKNTEGMVDAIASNVVATFDTSEFSSRSEYFQEYKAYLDDIIRESMSNSEVAQGLYFTFNPDLTPVEHEIWYAYDHNGKLTQIDADFYAQKRNFSMPVQDNMLYYFKPIWNNAGSWTGPYLDPDVSLNMVSYSKAVYINGMLIGVTGADILTADTIDIVETMKLYDGSYSFLLDENYDFIIHPQYNETQNLKTVEGGKLAFIADIISEKKTGTLHFEKEHEDFIMGFSQLSNGWILCINQSTKDAYSTIRMLSYVILGLTIMAIALTIVFAVIFSKRFSKPILTASDQLKLLEMGDYTTSIPDELLNRRDDLGEFSRAISSIQTAIKLEASKNREKDMLMIYQSKQAKIGEMVGNIAHQWKQPLNNINMILLNLYDDYLYQDLDEKGLEEAIGKITRTIKTMSETIKDFTDFLKPNREKTEFEVDSCFQMALDLMEASIKYNGISITLDLEENLMLYGFPNEFSHVLFNVLNNARDATVKMEDGQKLIRIHGYSNEDTIIIEIFNTGDPIPEELLQKIFEPYVTTKNDKEGTGIGLYISKLIIEQRMNGLLELMNMETGVCCRISVKRRYS